MAPWTHDSLVAHRDDCAAWADGTPPASGRDLTGSEILYGEDPFDELVPTGVAETSPGWLVPTLEGCRG